MAEINQDNLNQIIATAYKTVMEIQNAAAEMVGTSTLWARATPVENSEDVVLQEYTLSHVGLECPKPVTVIVANPDYNPGNFIIDEFGLNYESNLELHITINDWQQHFGADTMPQKDDVVYVQIYHKLFEVRTAQVVYTLAGMPTYYRCIMAKYNPTASRRETEEFRESIEDLTVSQEDLFGDVISQEVADNNETVETAYNTTTYVDPTKEYDIMSIVVQQVHGAHNNLISNAYYRFKEAEKNIRYHSDLIYEKSADRSHLIYSCWVKREVDEVKESNIRFLKFFSKDSDYYYFTISTPLKLQFGDSVTITRGALLKINGTVVPLQCVEGFGIAIAARDMLKANKKLTRWYENAKILKIYKFDTINLLSGYRAEDDFNIFNLSYNNKEFYLSVNNKIKTIPLILTLDNWHYIMFDITKDSIRIVVSRLRQVEYTVWEDEVMYDDTIQYSLDDFTADYFMINNMGVNIDMCNIRLYENEYEMGDLYMQDMYSPITRNASKLILVDSPNVPNKDIFVSPVK